MVYEDKLRKENGGKLGLMDRFECFAYHTFVDIVTNWPEPNSTEREKTNHLYDMAKWMQQKPEDAPDEKSDLEVANKIATGVIDGTPTLDGKSPMPGPSLMTPMPEDVIKKCVESVLRQGSLEKEN
jgi:hypothetical protein